jgi:hypothetical protein
MSTLNGMSGIRGMNAMRTASQAYGDAPETRRTPDELSTTARDLDLLMLAFREPLDARARKLIDARWPEVLEDLANLGADEDVVVLVSDARDSWPPRRLPHLMHSVVPRATAVALALVSDVRVADWLASSRNDPRSIDVVVEIDGTLAVLQVEHARGRTPSRPLPTIDVTRGFSVFNVRRGRETCYVFLDSGDAVATWDAVAALLGRDGRELDALIERADPEERELVLSWITWARLGEAIVRCVRIELVEAFARELELADEARNTLPIPLTCTRAWSSRRPGTALS